MRRSCPNLVVAGDLAFDEENLAPLAIVIVLEPLWQLALPLVDL